MRLIFPISGIVVCLLLVACGESPTPAAQAVTPLANVSTAVVGSTTAPPTTNIVSTVAPSSPTIIQQTSAVTSTPVGDSTTTLDPRTNPTTASAPATNPPTRIANATVTTPVAAAITAAPKTVAATIKPYVPATSANGQPITATPAYVLPTPPPTQPQSGGGQKPGTPLMLPTSAATPYGDYPTDSLLVVQVFLASFQLEPSGKNSTIYLSAALRAKVVQGATLLTLMDIPTMYTGFGVQGEPDTGRASILLQTDSAPVTRTVTLVRENGQWHIDGFTRA